MRHSSPPNNAIVRALFFSAVFWPTHVQKTSYFFTSSFGPSNTFLTKPFGRRSLENTAPNLREEEIKMCQLLTLCWNKEVAFVTRTRRIHRAQFRNTLRKRFFSNKAPIYRELVPGYRNGIFHYFLVLFEAQVSAGSHGSAWIPIIPNDICCRHPPLFHSLYARHFREVYPQPIY